MQLSRCPKESTTREAAYSFASSNPIYKSNFPTVSPYRMDHKRYKIIQKKLLISWDAYPIFHIISYTGVVHNIDGQKKKYICEFESLMIPGIDLTFRYQTGKEYFIYLTVPRVGNSLLRQKENKWRYHCEHSVWKMICTWKIHLMR